jgi:hypothetical protein
MTRCLPFAQHITQPLNTCNSADSTPTLDIHGQSMDQSVLQGTYSPRVRERLQNAPLEVPPVLQISPLTSLHI